jgi:hypothetical protein
VTTTISFFERLASSGFTGFASGLTVRPTGLNLENTDSTLTLDFDCNPTDETFSRFICNCGPSTDYGTFTIGLSQNGETKGFDAVQCGSNGEQPFFTFSQSGPLTMTRTYNNCVVQDCGIIVRLNGTDSGTITNGFFDSCTDGTPDNSSSEFGVALGTSSDPTDETKFCNETTMTFDILDSDGNATTEGVPVAYYFTDEEVNIAGGEGSGSVNAKLSLCVDGENGIRKSFESADEVIAYATESGCSFDDGSGGGGEEDGPGDNTLVSAACANDSITNYFMNDGIQIGGGPIGCQPSDDLEFEFLSDVVSPGSLNHNVLQVVDTTDPDNLITIDSSIFTFTFGPSDSQLRITGPSPDSTTADIFGSNRTYEITLKADQISLSGGESNGDTDKVFTTANTGSEIISFTCDGLAVQAIGGVFCGSSGTYVIELANPVGSTFDPSDTTLFNISKEGPGGGAVDLSGGGVVTLSADRRTMTIVGPSFASGSYRMTLSPTFPINLSYDTLNNPHQADPAGVTASVYLFSVP